MNEDLFYGPAAMRLRAAERHFGKLAPSDPRIAAWEDQKDSILRAHVYARDSLMGVPLPDAPPEPIDRSVLAKRLADRNGELALWLLCETVPRSFWRFPVNEFAELSRKGWEVLRTGRSGKLLGISFIASRVFDLRGLPPAAAAALYGEEPLLSAEDQMRLRWPRYSIRGSRAPSEIRRDVDRHQRESLLGYLRAGELLGTGVAEGEREPVPAAEWLEEIAAISEAFAAGRLGRWRDLLVRAPEIDPLPNAQKSQSDKARPSGKGGRPAELDRELLNPLVDEIDRENPALGTAARNSLIYKQLGQEFKEFSTEYLTRLFRERRAERRKSEKHNKAGI